MTIQEMKERKRELGYTNEQVAELSGIPLGTIQKIFGGKTMAPRYQTMQALEKVLRRREEPVGYQYGAWAQEHLVMREECTAYGQKRQGEYTLDDYYALPDEQRVELIDGMIYEMSVPTSVHQLMDGFIYAKFLEYIAGKKGKCLPIVSPIDVQLDCDQKTMVQPDVVIVCDRDKVIRRCVCGAPDFVLEILSQSTRKKDMVTKLNKYMNAGVREYWMIDPDQKRVLVYDFEAENYPMIYGFEAKVPVAIWDGECEIDFAEVYDYVRFLYEREENADFS